MMAVYYECLMHALSERVWQENDNLLEIELMENYDMNYNCTSLIFSRIDVGVCYWYIYVFIL
jgi:hypothetical protein